MRITEPWKVPRLPASLRFNRMQLLQQRSYCTFLHLLYQTVRLRMLMRDIRDKGIPGNRQLSPSRLSRLW